MRRFSITVRLGFMRTREASTSRGQESCRSAHAVTRNPSSARKNQVATTFRATRSRPRLVIWCGDRSWGLGRIGFWFTDLTMIRTSQGMLRVGCHSGLIQQRGHQLGCCSP